MTSRVERVTVLSPGGATAGERNLIVETPVAVEVNGLGYAVMMMTPEALPEFATGFMLTERLADGPGDILDIEPFEAERGWIVRVTLAERCAARIHDRVRHRSSDTSCGLCGLSGLEQVVRPVPGTPPRPTATREAIFTALAVLRDHQPLTRLTGAAHAAAWVSDLGEIGAVFEDVGRHNALDKLIGARASADADGFILVTSRLSFEMVDKALVAGAPMLVGISAATTMAVDHARTHGLTLVALARTDAMLVLNDPWGAFGKDGSGGGT